MYLNLCRELVKNGWSLSDIEENSFEMMMKIVRSKPKQEKKKEVDLKDFLKSI